MLQVLCPTPHRHTNWLIIQTDQHQQQQPSCCCCTLKEIITTFSSRRVMIFFIYSSNDISSIRLSACLRLYQTNEAYTQRCQSLTTKRFHTNYIVMFSPSSALWSFCTSVCVCEYVFFPPFQPETPPLHFPLRESMGVLFFYSVENSIHISNIFPYFPASAWHASVRSSSVSNDAHRC